jgi:hypothetical protein
MEVKLPLEMGMIKYLIIVATIAIMTPAAFQTTKTNKVAFLGPVPKKQISLNQFALLGPVSKRSLKNHFAFLGPVPKRVVA